MTAFCAFERRLESTLSGHCVIATAQVVIRASGHFIGASWSVQFRWVQPLGNEHRSGLQLSSDARTAHAERLIASRTYDLAFLARCTLYRSAEPCATWAGAICWAGIGRVVYGREKALKEQTGAHEENPTLDLPCGPVFAAGRRPTVARSGY